MIAVSNSQTLEVIALCTSRLLASMLFILSVAVVPTVAAADSAPLLVRCGTDSKCGKGYECVISSRFGRGGVCVPKSEAGSDDDDACLHRANCAAAAALRRVCPGCVITPIMTCGGVPSSGSSDPWYREHWERLKDCLTPTPEQIRASAVQSVRPSSQQADRKGPIEIEEGPDLDVYFNQWNINVPAAWAASRNRDPSELDRRKGRLENALDHLSEFNAPCPINNIDVDGTATLIAGTCGAFRNPDPTKRPPSMNYPRTAH